jgi:hypothetical protein
VVFVLVQHDPNFAPVALTQTPLFPLVPQQLWSVRQTSPSALQGPASAAPGVTPRARTPMANSFMEIDNLGKRFIVTPPFSQCNKFQPERCFILILR